MQARGAMEARAPKGRASDPAGRTRRHCAGLGRRPPAPPTAAAVASRVRRCVRGTTQQRRAALPVCTNVGTAPFQRTRSLPLFSCRCLEVLACQGMTYRGGAPAFESSNAPTARSTGGPCDRVPPFAPGLPLWPPSAMATTRANQSPRPGERAPRFFFQGIVNVT